MKRALAILAGVTGLALTSWASAAEAPVTLDVQTYIAHNKLRTHVFSGIVSSGAAGEVVTVLAKRCLYPGYTSVAGTHTGAGGVWRVEITQNLATSTFRARWEDRFSQDVKVWTPIFINSSRVYRRSVTAIVSTFDTQQEMLRRFIQLQRYDQTSGTWQIYRRARLTRLGGAYSYGATFRKLPRGLTLRIVVPRKSAQPCYQARAGETFRS